MKAFVYPMLALVLSAFCVVGFAATPLQISFSAKKKSFLSGTYKVYRVRCSDGSKGIISQWKKPKPWCTGTSRKRCYSSQLKAAARVCK